MDREIYRASYGVDLTTAYLRQGETDLAICLPAGVWRPELAEALFAHIMELRAQLQAYIAGDPVFLASHAPHTLLAGAPAIAQAMANAAALAGVGPMAAVAGAFAQAAGEFLAAHSTEVIVENGGDIYLGTSKERIVGVYAGPQSLYTGKLGLKIAAGQQPLGICTSSGTVGPSFSYGKADAAVILATNALLADAAATALGNRVQTAQDVGPAVEFAAVLPGVSGALAICGQALAACGAIELVDLSI